MTFEISPKSFYQVNPHQTKVLYDQIVKLADLSPEKTIVDAYCGVGTIGLYLAKRVKQIYGVEILPEAIDNARDNARRNGINNAHFEVGDAESVVSRWYHMIPNFTPDVFIVDPPRTGCSQSLIDSILHFKPKRVIYVSCNPSTLARDLNLLETQGTFKVKEIQPVDLFPHTYHCEAVAVVDFVPQKTDVM